MWALFTSAITDCGVLEATKAIEASKTTETAEIITLICRSTKHSLWSLRFYIIL